MDITSVLYTCRIYVSKMSGESEIKRYAFTNASCVYHYTINVNNYIY